MRKCHNNSVNSSFAYSDNATVSHYATKTNLIATQDCTNCHKNTANATKWGNALDPASSRTFPHSISNTPTEECYTCHNSAINFHNKTLVKPLVSTVTCLDCHKTTATMAPKKIDASVIASGVHKDRACENCHAGATNTNMNTYSFTSDPARTCTYCHTGAGNFSAPLVAEHNQNGQDVTTTSASCTTCHSNSGMYLTNSGTNGSSSAITHYLKDVTNTATTPYQHFGPINTSNCIDCHNGPNTSNSNWGSPVNISTSTMRPHTETLTSECNTCHSDGKVSLANVDFHNASVQLGAGGCTGCHSNVNSVSLGLHSNLSGTSAVEDSDCQTCHFGSFPMANGSANSANTYYCQDCHTSAGTGSPKPSSLVSVSHGSVECKWCHAAGDQPDYKYHSNTVGSVQGPRGTATGQNCATCHYYSNLSALPFRAPGETHSNALDECGTVCHENANYHYAPTESGIPPTITQPTINGFSGTTSIASGYPAYIQATVSDGMMVVSAAQYQITNGAVIVKDWTNMTGAFNSGTVGVSATLDTTSLMGTYTVNVKGMASGPKSGSGPNYPLNGQWSSIASTQLIVTESKGYINGTVRNNSVNISGAIVTTNTGVTAISDANGFYSLSLTNGTYQLTTVKEPEFYTNSSVSVTATAPTTITRDIILNRKPTGTISGKVAVK